MSKEIRVTAKVGNEVLIKNVELSYLICHFCKQPEKMFDSKLEVTLEYAQKSGGISPCPKCDCETVVFKDDGYVCEKCGEKIL